MSSFDTTVLAGRYHVIRRLGAGGTAAVFLTRDERLDREVAVKRLHGAEVTERTGQRLQREARIMASLHHPNLVTVYDMVMDGDDLLLAMEYVHGETLADVLASAPLDWERTWELLEPVASALDHVHGCGVVHRDLKPSNILVGAEGVVKVADLGLATAAEITKITPPGAILGTPAYMAPEQARAVPCTAAVDVYAFATIVFQALSGTLPRSGSTVLAVLGQATEEPPPDLRERRPETPAAAAEALARAMSPEPEQRQGSASRAARGAGRRLPGRAAVRTPCRSSGREGRAGAAPARARAGDRGARGRRRSHRRPLALRGTTRPLRRRQSPQAATPTREPTRTATPAAPRALSATATVRAFYRRAAAGEFAAAWRLAGPAMRDAFGGSFERFRSDLSSLRRIEFERVAVVGRDDASATVEIESVATHDDHVERCSGTLRTIRGSGGRWLVEPAGVTCRNG